MRLLQKHKIVKILACMAFLLALTVGIKAPAYAAAQCLNGDNPVANPSTDGQLVCPDGSSPCYNGIDDSGTTPHCTPAPSSSSSCADGSSPTYNGSSLICADGTTPGSTSSGNGSGGGAASSGGSDGTVVTCPDGSAAPLNNTANCQTSGPYCGDAQHGIVHTSIDLGCAHKGNAVMDMLFAIVRWLSAGVGIVIVASLIVAGVQYSASGGDPNAAKTAMHRIRSSLTALLVFIFAYAILNYVIPGAVLG